MGNIGNGYGSECQLLRYLGRHRNLLNQKVLAMTGGEEISWQDFNFDSNPKSKWHDAELKGIDFLQPAESLKVAWSKFWPTGRGIHNWDAVGQIKFGSRREWLLVEAKSHTEELVAAVKAAGGLDTIRNAFSEVKKAFGVDVNADWLRPYYQYCNRLAFLYFLDREKIPARLLFVYFLGDSFKGRTCPKTETEWGTVLAKQKSSLGLMSGFPLEDRVHTLFLQVCPRQSSIEQPA